MPMMTSLTIPVAFDLILLLAGIKSYIAISPERHPMALWVGATGTGKSYAISQYMARITTHIPFSQIYLCDFKDIDFRAYADTPRRWSFDACADGLTAFYNSFQSRLRGEDKSENWKFLVLDEWAAFILSRSDRKAQDEYKSMLSTLLMMGRGTQHFTNVCLQRGDSQLFPLGGRDQFSAIVALGNLSREQKLMLFPDFRERMFDINNRGQGYIYLDGEQSLRRIQIPRIVNQNMLSDAIREGLTR